MQNFALTSTSTYLPTFPCISYSYFLSEILVRISRRTSSESSDVREPEELMWCQWVSVCCQCVATQNPAMLGARGVC